MSIIITDLCKTFDDNEVLKNVNITLKDNSIYCLMGSSGIGKTTLLRILMGLEHADSGSVSGIDTKKHILYVSGGQAYSLPFCNRQCQNSASWKNTIGMKSVIICYQFFQMIVLIFL